MIRNAAELAETCAALRKGGVAALDTEFVWRGTYRPLLSLVQLGAEDGTSWMEDCLLGLDTAPLAEMLQDASTVKVLHDAHQDLDHLFHYTGALPTNVFDTQLAAAFAGLPARLSLQKLLAETVGITLPKTETMTDWTQRPLTPQQMSYALDDVRYLGEARAELVERARKLGTLAWMEEEMRVYEDPSLYGDPDPDEQWKRVKCGGVRLDRRGLACLRALAATRERMAMEWNIPRAWLGDDASLAEMAADGPMDAARLRFRNRLRNRGQQALVAAAFAKALKEGAAVPEEECPVDFHPHYIAEVKEAADNAMEFMRQRAEELHVDPAVIANRATVTAWVDDPGDPENPLAGGWRYEVVGRDIAEKFEV